MRARTQLNPGFGRRQSAPYRHSTTASACTGTSARPGGKSISWVPDHSASVTTEVPATPHGNRSTPPVSNQVWNTSIRSPGWRGSVMCSAVAWHSIS